MCLRLRLNAMRGVAHRRQITYCCATATLIVSVQPLGPLNPDCRLGFMRIFGKASLAMSARSCGIPWSMNACTKSSKTMNRCPVQGLPSVGFSMRALGGTSQQRPSCWRRRYAQPSTLQLTLSSRFIDLEVVMIRCQCCGGWIVYRTS